MNHKNSKNKRRFFLAATFIAVMLFALFLWRSLSANRLAQRAESVTTAVVDTVNTGKSCSPIDESNYNTNTYLKIPIRDSLHQSELAGYDEAIMIISQSGDTRIEASAIGESDQKYVYYNQPSKFKGIWQYDQAMCELENNGMIYLKK